MDKFTVTWHKSAEMRLADIWITSLVPNSVTRAANTIDNLLRQSPETVGEPLWNNTWFVRRYPLYVLFRVSPDDRLVEVLDVALDASSG